MKKILCVMLSLVIVLGLLSACSGKDEPAANGTPADQPAANTPADSQPAQPKPDSKTITVAKTGPLVGLDQHANSDGVSLEVIATLLDGLVTLDAEGNLVPTMAERWDVSDDGLTYTFYLRDAQWSNGTPVTAADFEYSWKRNVDPATASNYNYEAVTAGIKNAEAISTGRWQALSWE